MAKKHKKLSAEALAALAVLNGVDGPPDILTHERGEMRPTPGEPGLPMAVTYRSAVVSDDVPWKDPTDMSARARSHGAREIKGWRRVWQISAMHHRNPREITAVLVRAAEKLLADYEFGIEGATNGRTYDRVDGASSGGISGDRLDAVRRYREAMAVCGAAGAEILVWVVIDNHTNSWLGEKLGIHRDQAHGRLYSSLQRLREHYWPNREAPAPTPIHEPELAIMDLDAGGLAAERLGRWRRRAVA